MPGVEMPKPHDVAEGVHLLATLLKGKLRIIVALWTVGVILTLAVLTLSILAAMSVEPGSGFSAIITVILFTLLQLSCIAWIVAQFRRALSAKTATSSPSADGPRSTIVGPIALTCCGVAVLALIANVVILVRPDFVETVLGRRVLAAIPSAERDLELEFTVKSIELIDIVKSGEINNEQMINLVWLDKTPENVDTAGPQLLQLAVVRDPAIPKQGIRTLNLGSRVSRVIRLKGNQQYVVIPYKSYWNRSDAPGAPPNPGENGELELCVEYIGNAPREVSWVFRLTQGWVGVHVKVTFDVVGRISDA